MNSNVLTRLRLGLVALGVMAGLSAPALAMPAGFMSKPIAGAATSEAAPKLVQWNCSYGGPGCRNNNTGAVRSRDQIRNGDTGQRRGREVRRDDRRWDGDRRWSRNRHWDNDRRWRRDYPRYRSGPNIYLGLGVPAYRYVDPYYAPRYVAPRRAYGMSSSHVSWCYDRWRSYRAYDNTYQPYNGPRRQCVSPYG